MALQNFEPFASLLEKFLDNAKLGGVADALESCAALQRDLNKLETGAENCLKFNSGKCRVLHPMPQYRLEADLLGRSAEKGLGILVDNKQCLSQHCDLVPKRANVILGYIRRNSASSSKMVILLLCSAIVRPCQDYCV